MEEDIKMRYRGVGRGRGNRNCLKPVEQPYFNVDDKLDLTTDQNKENIINKVQCYKNKTRNNYVPNDFAEEYKLRVNKGINFDNYDSFEVSVTGREIPLSISSIDDVYMPSFLKNNIINYDYKKLTPVQKYAIPIIDCGRDLIAIAQTGSGKTIAYLVPIIKAIYENDKSTENKGFSPRCIIIVPTRELCRQIFTVAQRLCENSPVKCGYMYGGIDFNILMTKMYKSEILISTPYHLILKLKSRKDLLTRLSYLVLDEADMLLEDYGLSKSIKSIFNKLDESNDKKYQVSMFSATFPKQVQSLAESLLFDQLFVAVGLVGSANLDITQEIIRVTRSTKLETFFRYVTENRTGKTLIFVENKRFADFLGIRLSESKLLATTIHGARNQYYREIALNDFKSGRVDYLVSTDVSSRGLDIPLVDTVVNFDMPDTIDYYVHRIGRTGRCGNPGFSVSFFDPVKNISLAPHLMEILENAHQKCPYWLEQLALQSIRRDSTEEDCRTKLSNFDDQFMNCNDDL